MSFVLFFNISLGVFASPPNDDSFGSLMSLSNINNILMHGFENMGVFLNPSLWGTGALYDRYEDYLKEQAIIADSENITDYMNAHVSINETDNGDYEYSLDNDIVNNLYNFAVQYIEENTGFWIYPTASVMDYINYSLNLFNTTDCLNATKNYIDSCSNSTVFYSFGIYSYTLEDGSKKYGVQFYTFDYSLESLISSAMAYGSTNSSDRVTSQQTNIWKYDSNWQANNIYTKVQIDEGGNVTTSDYSISAMKCYPIGQKQHYYKQSVAHYFYYYHWWCDSPTIPDGFTAYSTSSGMYTINRDALRIYMSLDDLIQYTVGQRPYYTTSEFYNYDSTVDNSTTITQTEIDNSVTYGDVYNYITNNYDNPDGLTEDELRAILAEYFSSINNSGGSGGSGGGSDSGGSGGGLGGFLDGLGSIGNAILAILGKLMEILGSAIELVTVAITDLITIIPNSIGELLGALFPVFPEEWIKAITLSLVLGVVVGIVRMFK